MLVKKIFTKNCLDVHYFLTDFSYISFVDPVPAACPRLKLLDRTALKPRADFCGRGQGRSKSSVYQPRRSSSCTWAVLYTIYSIAMAVPLLNSVPCSSVKISANSHPIVNCNCFVWEFDMKCDISRFKLNTSPTTELSPLKIEKPIKSSILAEDTLAFCQISTTEVSKRVGVESILSIPARFSKVLCHSGLIFPHNSCFLENSFRA